MKFNITIELDNVEEDYTLDDLVMDEIKYEISNTIAKEIAEKNLFKFNSEKEIKEIKKAYENEIIKLQQITTDNLEAARKLIKEEFINFVNQGIVTCKTGWGGEVTKTSIGELIKDQATKYYEDNKRMVGNSIEKKIDDLKFGAYDIEKMIKEHSIKISKENALKVTEFLMKGLK